MLDPSVVNGRLQSGPVKCFVKRFPFMDERWEHATYSLSEYGTFIKCTIFANSFI